MKQAGNVHYKAAEFEQAVTQYKAGLAALAAAAGPRAFSAGARVLVYPQRGVAVPESTPVLQRVAAVSRPNGGLRLATVMCAEPGTSDVEFDEAGEGEPEEEDNIPAKRLVAVYGGGAGPEAALQLSLQMNWRVPAARPPAAAAARASLRGTRVQRAGSGR